MMEKRKLVNITINRTIENNFQLNTSNLESFNKQQTSKRTLSCIWITQFPNNDLINLNFILFLQSFVYNIHSCYVDGMKKWKLLFRIFLHKNAMFEYSQWKYDENTLFISKVRNLWKKKITHTHIKRAREKREKYQSEVAMNKKYVNDIFRHIYNVMKHNDNVFKYQTLFNCYSILKAFKYLFSFIVILQWYQFRVRMQFLCDCLSLQCIVLCSISMTLVSFQYADL